MEADGNTITPEACLQKGQRQQARNWVFTLNNYTQTELEALDKVGGAEPISWLVYGLEVGDEGTPHVQGALACSKRLRLTQVTKLVPRAHFAVMKGSPQQSKDYCGKQNGIKEFGNMPLSSGQSTKEVFSKALALAKSGQVEEIRSDLLVRYYNTWQRISRDYQVAPANVDVLDNWWYVGPPGCGKSRSARGASAVGASSPNRGFFPKASNRWWCGYQNEELVIIDDFELESKCLGHYLKLWGDHYPFQAETKGSSYQIRPRSIIVTSNYTIEQVFGWDHEMVAAISRRYQVKRFV